MKFAAGCVKCTGCGEIYKSDDLAELWDMGEPFYQDKNCFLCPDCYAEYSALDAEEKLDFVMNLPEPQEELRGQEYNVYVDEIAAAMTDVLKKVLPIADKYSVDRDDAMKHFSDLLSAMVSVSTFAHFDLGSE